MALYAYRDLGRNNIIYASDGTEEDRDIRFYCPNVNCNAHLYICAVNGSRRAYFRATHNSNGHIAMCPFSFGDDSEVDQFDKDAFIFISAIDKILEIDKGEQRKKSQSDGHDIGAVKEHPPRTILQIYRVCKSFSERELYGDAYIGDILLDDRSLYRYPKGCFGKRIIEVKARGMLYNDTDKEIYLEGPLNSLLYTFVLRFLDSDLYKSIRREVYNNRDKIIVIAGDWEKYDQYNHFVTSVVSKKQIAIIR